MSSANDVMKFRFRSYITKTASLIRLLYTGIKRARSLRADSTFWKEQSRWSRCDLISSLPSKAQFLNNHVRTVFARTRVQRRRVNSFTRTEFCLFVCNFRFCHRPESIKIHECTAKSKVIESRTSDFESKRISAKKITTPQAWVRIRLSNHFYLPFGGKYHQNHLEGGQG